MIKVMRKVRYQLWGWSQRIKFLEISSRIWLVAGLYLSNILMNFWISATSQIEKNIRNWYFYLCLNLGGSCNKEYALHILQLCQGDIESAVLYLMVQNPKLPMVNYQILCAWCLFMIVNSKIQSNSKKQSKGFHQRILVDWCNMI